MNVIKEKKIKKWVINLALYLSLCFSGWYSSRNALASIVGAYPEYSYLNNDIVAFFIAGVMPLVIYVLVVKFISFGLRHTPYLPLDDMIYALPFFYFAANLVIGAFNVLYYFVPLASIWGGIIVPLVATAAFFAWYLAFVCKNYVKNYNWKAIVLFFGRIYLIVAFVITALGLVAEVL